MLSGGSPKDLERRARDAGRRERGQQASQRDGKSLAAVELGRRDGIARAKTMKRPDRVRIARQAARVKWKEP